jgi:tetratricopeptide (TPR) repeat protein
LGHLIDAALYRSQDALPYLRKARELDPHDDEVAASLAQCLARLDQFDEAMDLARHAFCTAEIGDGHRDLIRWINARKTRALRATSP